MSEVGEGVSIDRANRNDLERFFAKTDEYLGGVDVVVFNAAV